MKDSNQRIQKRVVVIGAGVIGLQIAVTLLEAGYKVTIVAKDFPGDQTPEYTSMWAGAQWRPHAKLDDPEQCDWDLQSYNTWMSEIDDDPSAAEKRGLKAIPSHIFTTSPSPSPPSFWFLPYIRSPSRLSTSSLPLSAHSGISFTTIAINAPLHILTLLRRATLLGAFIIRTSLPDNTLAALISQANVSIHHGSNRSTPSAKPQKPDNVFAFVNATGLGALALEPSTLGSDGGMYPIRGQTVLVSGSSPKMLTYEDPQSQPLKVSYVIPRPDSDTTILGGTYLPNEWSTKPDDKTTEEILENAKILWSEGVGKDGKFEVLDVKVGLRPARKGGARIEVEMLELAGDEGEREEVKVVHAYGHAGAGFQNSVGVARKVLGLLEGRKAERVYVKDNVIKPKL